MEKTDTPIKDKVRKTLSHLHLEEKLIAEILLQGRFKSYEAGRMVISPGDPVKEIPLVIEGALNVLRIDDKGNELFLYFLEGGETCAMSITCCLEHKNSGFQVVAEEDSLVWFIPVANLDQWVCDYPAFRRFVFLSYQSRFDEMMESIDSIAFMHMDERLYNYLLDKKQSSGSYTIHKTHQEIARALNTSRVVISRLLKKLEQEGKIEQQRNRIEVL
jgi:CRP/FNR family transcriptional regulator